MLIADFKSNLPETGRFRDAALVQLAIYRALMRDLYSDRPVDCVLVVLDGPRLVRPGAAELDRALAILTA